MHSLARLALCLVWGQFTLARAPHSLPEDIHAFPKYRVTFLNDLPVLNDTAEQWRHNGLHGGELEFLDRPWAVPDDPSVPPPERRLDGQEHPTAIDLQQVGRSAYTLEYMKFGPKASYVCLVPPPLDIPIAAEEPMEEEEATAHSWSLLQPLNGHCLYYQQGWFTYSYCHNHQVRQFRQLATAFKDGHFRIEEDPEYESFTLGRAPTSPETGADLTVSEQHALTANLELAREADSRYLVQRWGDGTVCDKTGKRREIEVQFHCSMTMTDQIVLVKEAKTCSYVLIIHTPRLCAEPGFKSRTQVRDEALIRCREIVTSLPPHVIQQQQQQQQQAGSAEFVVMAFDHPVSDLIVPHEPLFQISLQSPSAPARGAAAAGTGGNGGTPGPGAAAAAANNGAGSPPTSKLLMDSEKVQKAKQDKKLGAIRQAIEALLVAEGNALGLDDDDNDFGYHAGGDGHEEDNGAFRIIQVDEDGTEFVVELDVLDLFFPADQEDDLDDDTEGYEGEAASGGYMQDADVQRSQAIHEAVKQALRGVGYSVDDAHTTTTPKKPKQQQQQQQKQQQQGRRRREKDYSGPYDEL